MRVTTDSQYQQLVRNVQRNLAAASTLEDQLSSGVRLQRPSDGPAEMVRVLYNKQLDARLTTRLATIRDASTVLEASTTALTDVKNVLAHAKEVALQASNTATSDPSVDEAFAQQIDGAINSLLQIANRRLPDGRYLFSGSASQTQPFTIEVTDSAGRPTRIGYHGSDDSTEVQIDQGQTLETLIPGRVLRLQHRAPTAFDGSTGAKPGTGTDSAAGQATLLVQHTLTTIDGASGIATGDSSTTGDTILGPLGANSLAITDNGDGSGTISLNGGPVTTYQNTDTDLKVTGPNGEVIFLNTTAIVAGFSGTVDLMGEGTLSLDGGQTITPIDFTNNQTLTDSTGAITNIDSSGIRKAGQEQLDYQGTEDAFQILTALRDDIRNTNGLSNDERNSALTHRLDELDRMTSGVLDVLGTQGIQSELLTQWKDRAADVQLSLQKQTDELESVDVASAVTKLSQQQSLYQMSLSLITRLNSLDLSQFLR